MKSGHFKNIFIAAGLVLFLFGIPSSSSSENNPAPVTEISEQTEGLTLQDCYQFALKQSEQLAIQQEFIKEAEARFVQSLSGILPHVSFERTELYEHGSSGSAGESRFIFSQPLFSGFKEFAAMAGSKAEQRQRKYELLRAQQLLFTDVSDAFYLFSSYQDDLNALLSTKQALIDRVDELNKRMELGRSRISEVASAEASLSLVEADVELVISQKEVSRELLEFLTGQNIDRVKDTEPFPSAPDPQKDFTVLADRRPDVLAAHEALEVAKKEVTIARAGFWPTVSVDGNYYDERFGSSVDDDWNATFTVNVPIFEGGINIGNVKQAVSIRKQAELLYEQKKRLAVLDIRNIYTQLQAGIRRTAALEKALKATERNYQLLREDYQVNLINNLEVLRGLEDTYTARRSFIDVESETKRLYWNFRVATGDI